MSLLVTTQEGMITDVKPLENESTNVRGGSDTAGGNARNSRRAFSKHRNEYGESGGSNSPSQSIGDIDPSGSDRSFERSNEQPSVDDRGSEGSEQSGAGNVTGSGSTAGGSRGTRYGIEPRRTDETADDYKRRYKREYRAWQRAEAKRTQSTERMGSHQENDLEQEEGFSLTVESPAVVNGESLDVEVIETPQKEKKAAPRAKRGSKYKEPSKDAVSFTASMIKDMYSFSDGTMMLVSALMDKFYIQGTMEIDEEKAEKIAHALVRMNNSLPQWAEKINKFSAPMTLVSVLVPDLIMKGMMIRGQWSNKKQS